MRSKRDARKQPHEWKVSSESLHKKSKRVLGSLRIGITGTPGTGKKSVGREIARLLGLEFVSVDTVAKKLGAASFERGLGEYVVDWKKIYGKVPTSGRVISGHLLSQIIPPKDLDFVAVLRCSPKVLRRRLSLRKYPPDKIRENLEAELLDLVSYEALRAYGREKVSEFDTSNTRDPKKVAKQIVETIKGKRKKVFGRIRWAEKAGKSERNLFEFTKPEEKTDSMSL